MYTVSVYVFGVAEKDNNKIKIIIFYKRCVYTFINKGGGTREKKSNIVIILTIQRRG